MRIENLLPSLIRNKSNQSQKEEKTEIVAKEVFASLPTIGFEPITIGVVCAAGGAAVMWAAGKLFTAVTTELTDKASIAIAQYFFPDKAKLFTNNYFLKAYYNGELSGNSIVSQPEPIFKSEIAEVINKLRNSSKNAKKHGTQLQSAILSGDVGTGKTTTLEGIARGSDCNYFIFNGDQFINFLQNADISKFFTDFRSNKLPTIFVIDQADPLFETDDDNVKRAIQQFVALVNNNDPKLMFLFATEVPFNKMNNRAFLGRMDYKINIEKPGPEELKKIISQHAKSIFTGTFANSFTEDVCGRLAQGVFKGQSGRMVKKALVHIGPFTSQMSEKELNSRIAEYIKTHGD